MPNERGSGRRGGTDSFTLVEIVVVVLVLMIGIIPIYQTIVRQAKTTRFNRRRAFAASLANDILELMKRMKIKKLCDEAGNIDGIYNPVDDSKDPIIAVWKDPRVSQLMSSDKKIKRMIDGYRKELKHYKNVFVTVKPSTVSGLEDRQCTVQVRVVYEIPEHGAYKHKTVASAMVLTDPTFPAGKALQP